MKDERLEKMKQDFMNLKINYSILDDLNVGDGETQIMVANNDLPKVEFWMKTYNQDLINRGEEPVDMRTVTMEEYTHTGKLTEEQYANTASDELKEINEKYEGREPGEVERYVAEQEEGIRSIKSEGYEEYRNNPEYVEISIDLGTLVHNSRYANAANIKENGLFACRIPSTYGAEELTLAVPEERVFQLNKGQQYRAFLKKNEKPYVLDARGKLLSYGQRMTGQEIRNSYFDPVKGKEKKKAVGKVKEQTKDFNNFQKRKYNYNALERALTGKL